MTLAEACAWTLARSLLVALPATAAAWAVVQVMKQRPLRGRSSTAAWALWLLLLAPLVMPTLLTAYVYRQWALGWERMPWRVEAMYAALLVARYVPIAVLVMLFAPPPPVSAQALHAAKLAGSRWRFGFIARGPGRHLLIAGAAVMVLGFIEYEIADLLFVSTWTVQLFQAQVMRTPWQEMARLLIWPLVAQAAVLGPVLWLLLRSQRAGEREPVSIDRPWVRRLAWVYLIAAAIIGCAYPLIIVTASAARGLEALLQQDLMLMHTAYGVRQAMFAALLATAIALVARRSRGPVALAVCLPGLFGPLMLGVAMLHLFQWSPLRGQYHTMLPLLATHTLWLLPIAVLLAAMLVAQHSPALHAAMLLDDASSHRVRRAGRRLIARAWVRPIAWIVLALFCLAYFELTATTLLAPAGAEPAVVSAYNNMHYGQYDVLSARVMLSFITAGAVVAVGAAVVRVGVR